MFKNEEGFTLLELLIAVTILGIVIAPYLGQFIKATEIGERSERIVRAEYIAQQVLEEQKRLATLPISGDSWEETRDNMTVKVTYSDKTSDVSTPEKSLEFYEDSVNADILIIPEIGDDNVDFTFQVAPDGAILRKVTDVAFGHDLNIELRSTLTDNLYELFYSIDDGAASSFHTFTKLEGESVTLQFIGDTDKEASGDIDIKFLNATTTKERTIELYEYDDVKNNFNFGTHVDNSGEVVFVLKIISDTETNINNELDYYWVHIEVFDSSKDLLTELYSSIRKE